MVVCSFSKCWHYVMKRGGRQKTIFSVSSQYQAGGYMSTTVIVSPLTTFKYDKRSISGWLYKLKTFLFSRHSAN